MTSCFLGALRQAPQRLVGGSGAGPTSDGVIETDAKCPPRR
jgi:hypothetical protein